MNHQWANQVTLPLKFICNAEEWLRINTNQQEGISEVPKREGNKGEKGRHVCDYADKLILRDTNEL